MRSATTRSKRRLSAARRAEQRQEAAARDCHADPLQRRHRAALGGEAHRHVAQPNRRTLVRGRRLRRDAEGRHQTVSSPQPIFGRSFSVISRIFGGDHLIELRLAGGELLERVVQVDLRPARPPDRSFPSHGLGALGEFDAQHDRRRGEFVGAHEIGIFLNQEIDRLLRIGLGIGPAAARRAQEAGQQRPGLSSGNRSSCNRAARRAARPDPTCAW